MKRQGTLGQGTLEKVSKNGPLPVHVLSHMYSLYT